MLTIYIDFKSPASYLAMAPALAMLERHNIKADWQPLPAFERTLPTHVKSRKIAQSHFETRQVARRATFIKYAAFQGIDLKFPDEPGSSDLALGAD